MTEGGHRGLAWSHSAHVDHDEPQRTADGGVGAKARTEDAERAVETDPLTDRPVHDDERGGEVGGRGHAVQVEGRIARCLNGSEEDGEIVRAAARHYRVDGDLLHGGAAVVGSDLAYQLRTITRRARKHTLHTLAAGWDDGQAVGYALLEPGLEIVHGSRAMLPHLAMFTTPVGEAIPRVSCRSLSSFIRGLLYIDAGSWDPHAQVVENIDSCEGILRLALSPWRYRVFLFAPRSGC